MKKKIEVGGMSCGHCDSRCPFGDRQSARMAEIARSFASFKAE